MFKTSSGNAQSRTVRTALESRANQAGIAPSAFAKHPTPNDPPPSPPSLRALEDERELAAQHKIDCEHRLHVIKAQLTSAERAYHVDRQTALSRQLYEKLLNDREDATTEIWRAEQRLREINRKIKDAQRESAQRKHGQRRVREQTFADVFLELAKEMLAQPVYDRITVAAIHRIRERKEREDDDA